MDPDSDICEPPVKKECLEEGLEMVNYEFPMQIDVPVAADAEIDPLMPVEPADEIKSEPALEEEPPDKTDGIDSALPEIDAAMSDFVIRKSPILKSFENSEPSARSDHADFTAEEIYISSDEEVEEITIEPKKEDIFKEISGNVDCDSQFVGAGGPGIQQLNRFQQATEKQLDSPILKTQLMTPPLDQLQPDAVNVRPLSHASHCMAESASSSSVSIIGQVQQTAAEFLSSVERRLEHQIMLPPSPVASTSSHQDPPCSQPVPKPISVNMLLRSPFSSDAWTREQKIAIIKTSRPKPDIKLSLIPLPGVSAERFYNEIPWLCGSPYLEKFFCWPCLLFFYPSATSELWSVPAMQAVLEGEFNQSWKAHEASCIHQAAEKTLQIWLQSVNAPPPPNSNKDLGNSSVIERVRKNRKLLYLLVHSVCYLKKERHDAQIEDYAECFDYVVQSNSQLQQSLAEFQGDFSEKSATDFVFHYANLIEDAVRKFLRSKVSDEIKNARFITLFLEDLSTTVEESSVAVISHFLDQDGNIQERILELIKIGDDRSAAKIFSLFRNVVFKFGLRPKVAGFTYSATVVYPSEMALFNRRVQQLCPVGKFFHYQRHCLRQMLFGAVSHVNRNCGNFFAKITEFQRFFIDHRITSTFRRIEQFKSKLRSQPKYNLGYSFITLKRCYSSVLKTLYSILERPEDWDDKISSQARMFMSFLREFNTRFMITLIYQMTVATVDISEALQGKIDTAEWKLLIRRGVSNLSNIRSYGFKDIYLAALSPILVKETNELPSDFPPDLVAVFNEIVDTAVRFLHQRFTTEDFGYIDLETVAQRYYTRLNLRPADTEKFRAQIRCLAKEPMIKNKTLAEALRYFYERSLAAAVPEYATFLEFAMTIPSSNSSLHSPAVERILTYQRDRSFKPPADLIWMEKELLTDIFRNKKLSDAVIDIFVTSQNTKEFSYQDISVTQDIGVQ